MLFTKTSPLVTLISRISIFIRVDLPDPLGPIKKTNSRLNRQRNVIEGYRAVRINFCNIMHLYHL